MLRVFVSRLKKVGPGREEGQTRRSGLRSWLEGQSQPGGFWAEAVARGEFQPQTSCLSCFWVPALPPPPPQGQMGQPTPYANRGEIHLCFLLREFFSSRAQPLADLFTWVAWLDPALCPRVGATESLSLARLRGPGLWANRAAVGVRGYQVFLCLQSFLRCNERD